MPRLHHIKLTKEEEAWPPVLKDPAQASGSSCEPGEQVYTFQVAVGVSVAAKNIHQALRELGQVRDGGRIIIGDAKLFFSESDVRQPLSVHVYDPLRDKEIERP